MSLQLTFNSLQLRKADHWRQDIDVQERGQTLMKTTQQEDTCTLSSIIAIKKSKHSRQGGKTSERGN